MISNAPGIGWLAKGVAENMSNTLVRSSGWWVKHGGNYFDSRSEEWKTFLRVLGSSPIASDSVVVVIMPGCQLGPGYVQELDGDVEEELSTYIRTLPVKRLIYENRNLKYSLGCFASAGEAIQLLVDVLKKPPSKQCPLAASLDVGQSTACLSFLFADGEINVSVFRE